MRVDTGRLRVVAAEPVESLELDAAAPLPEEPGSTTPGAYLRAQRERRGLSLEQLAAQTKIPRRQLELLEHDRFEELPGMVFTKGFLRCCARALELDPDAVLGLLYEREREQLRARRRDAVPAAAPEAPKRRRSGGQLSAWVAGRLGELPAARIVMWLVVALLVAIVVLVAFTLASSQAETLMIRS